MNATKADIILDQWNSLTSEDMKCQEWSTLLDCAIEIGETFIDWTNDITYVRFEDGSILGWDCFFIRYGSEAEIAYLR